MQERRGLCHPPVLGRALSTRPVPPTSPMPRPLGLALAMGDADPGPGMGQDVCVSPRVSAVGCNQLCDSPTAATPPKFPSPATPQHGGPQAPVLSPCPTWPSPPSWSTSNQQRRERRTGEHTAMRRVFYSCASSSSPGQDSGPPRTSPLGTQGWFLRSSSLQRCGSRTQWPPSLWRQRCYSCS